jgi:dTDP-4-amino-4,6-dideoxygalactose transaminase
VDSRLTIDPSKAAPAPGPAAPALEAGVPFTDMARLHAPIRAELLRVATEVIDGGRYIGGPQVKGFETEMAAWLGVNAVCGVGCATSGLFALLKALGVGPGDEVITTPHTAIPTAEAISLTGARVVFCDLRPGYFFVDPEQVARRITPRTKALLPVHLYGQPVDMAAFLALGREHGLPVVEDCAQAQGAWYGGRRVGTLGDAAAFSFFPSKNLGGFGDGGAITARDPEVLRRARMFCNHGRESKYDHEFEGMNSRLDSLQAALLRVELPHLDEWNACRLRAARWYDMRLADVEAVTTPQVLEGTTPVYHVYAILAPDRDALAAHLEREGIETGIHYPHSLNLLQAYAWLQQGAGSFPRAEHACAHTLSLPMHPSITEAEVERVCASIRRFFGR